MHESSYLKAVAFCEHYVKPYAAEHGSAKILDIGSKSYQGHKDYGTVFRASNIQYVGLDVEPGQNVDIVPGDLFRWSEISNREFDFCISGQVFEHNPLFWITFAEIGRILKPGGMAFVIAPGRGPVHRFPLDCWRFYPDAWSALCGYIGLELVETLFEEYAFGHVIGGAQWCDSCVAARVPMFSDATVEREFYARLDRIVGTCPTDAAGLMKPAGGIGKALSAYQKSTKASLGRVLKRRLAPRFMLRKILQTM